MNVDITVLVGIGSTLFGVVIGFLGYKRNENRDIKDDAKKDATTNITLDYISKNIDLLRVDVQTTNKSMLNINDRLIRAEESIKSAHHRIDGLEENK
ncbi:hypothetical protein [Clostridium baratii]|uniref:hypothetical protein n=1 Tax=Clostridium baratii TaxID=1561 RepID=UPI0030CF3689